MASKQVESTHTSTIRCAFVKGDPYPSVWKFNRFYGTPITKVGYSGGSEEILPENYTTLDRKRTRYVKHTKTLLTVGEPVTYWQSLAYSSTGTPTKAYWNIPDDAYGLILSNGDYESYDSAQDPVVTNERNHAISRAIKFSKPHISTALSLPNFLFELKDFKKMFNIFDRRYSPRKNVENGILNYNFGIKPFLSDISKMFEGIKRIRTFWDHVKSNQGRVVNWGTGNYSVDSGVTNVAKHNGTVANGYFDRQWSYRYQSRGSVRCQSVFKYDILDTGTGTRSDVIPKELLMKSAMQAFGVLLDPSIIWNAIPFSFVLDWLIPVNKALGLMAKDCFVPGHTVYKCELHTTDVKEVSTKGQLTNDTNPGYLNESKDYWVKDGVRIYERIPAVSPGDYSYNPLYKLKIRLPSGKHFFLGAVLGSKLFL